MPATNSIEDTFVAITDDTYPKRLKEIPNPPKLLYYKGNYNSMNFENCLGIVGSRKMTEYGREVIKYVLQTLTHRKITVVSGFTVGVDACVHRTCLELDIPTIGVFPGGLDICPHSSLCDVYEQFVYSGGLAVSEFACGFQPRIWSFPRRNRIVAGLCKALLVVEAAKDSGSLITSGFSRKFGRKVFAVPGNIFSDTSVGCNEILSTYAQAMYSNITINRFFEISGGLEKSKDTSKKVRDPIENKIVKLLRASRMPIDDISKILEYDIVTTSKLLTLLTLNGEITEEGGYYYASNH